MEEPNRAKVVLEVLNNVGYGIDPNKLEETLNTSGVTLDELNSQAHKVGFKGGSIQEWENALGLKKKEATEPVLANGSQSAGVPASGNPTVAATENVDEYPNGIHHVVSTAPQPVETPQVPYQQAIQEAHRNQTPDYKRDPQDVLAEINAQIAQNPNEKMLYIDRANVYHSLGDAAKATQDILKYHKLNEPDYKNSIDNPLEKIGSAFGEEGKAIGAGLDATLLAGSNTGLLKKGLGEAVNLGQRVGENTEDLVNPQIGNTDSEGNVIIDPTATRLKAAGNIGNAVLNPVLDVVRNPVKSIISGAEKVADLINTNPVANYERAVRYGTDPLQAVATDATQLAVGATEVGMGALSFIPATAPAAAAFNLAASAAGEVAPHTTKALMAPVSTIADEAGFEPKNQLQQNLLQLGDVAGNALLFGAFHLAQHPEMIDALAAKGNEKIGTTKEAIKNNIEDLKNKINNNISFTKGNLEFGSEIINEIPHDEIKKGVDNIKEYGPQLPKDLAKDKKVEAAQVLSEIDRSDAESKDLHPALKGLDEEAQKARKQKLMDIVAPEVKPQDVSLIDKRESTQPVENDKGSTSDKPTEGGITAGADEVPKFEGVESGGNKKAESTLLKDYSGLGLPDNLVNEMIKDAKNSDFNTFFSKYSASHLIDLSNRELHRVARAIQPYEDEPYFSIKDIIDGKGNDYLNVVKYDNKNVYNAIKNSEKDGKITIWRSIPKDAKSGIEAGDFVALEKSYADSHGGDRFNQKWKTVSMKVPIEDVVFGENDFAEWHYSPEKLRDKFGSLEKFWEAAQNEKNADEVKPTEAPVKPDNLEGVIGRTKSMVMPNGEIRPITYKVVEADKVTPSHNPLTFSQSEGYPVNEMGNTVNDRTYTSEPEKASVTLGAQKLIPQKVIDPGNSVGKQSEGQTSSGQPDGAGTPKPEPPTVKEPTPLQKKADKVDSQLQDEWQNFRKSITINSGINPDALISGAKIIKLLAEKGIYKLSDMAIALHEQFKEEAPKLWESFKAAYNHHRGSLDKESRKLYDNEDHVSDLTFEDALNQTDSKSNEPTQDQEVPDRETQKPTQPIEGEGEKKQSSLGERVQDAFGKDAPELNYHVLSNKTHVEAAKAIIEKLGPKDALHLLATDGELQDRRLDPPQRTALGRQLVRHWADEYKDLKKQGQKEKSKEALNKGFEAADVAYRNEVMYGRAISALQEYAPLLTTGEGVLKHVQRELSKQNAKIQGDIKGRIKAGKEGIDKATDKVVDDVVTDIEQKKAERDNRKDKALVEKFKAENENLKKILANLTKDVKERFAKGAHKLTDAKEFADLEKELFNKEPKKAGFADARKQPDSINIPEPKPTEPYNDKLTTLAAGLIDRAKINNFADFAALVFDRYGDKIRHDHLEEMYQKGMEDFKAKGGTFKEPTPKQKKDTEKVKETINKVKDAEKPLKEKDKKKETDKVKEEPNPQDFLDRALLPKHGAKQFQQGNIAKLINNGVLKSEKHLKLFLDKYNLRDLTDTEKDKLHSLADNVQNNVEGREQSKKDLIEYVKELKNPKPEPLPKEEGPKPNKAYFPVWDEYKNAILESFKEKGAKALTEKPALKEFSDRLATALRGKLNELKNEPKVGNTLKPKIELLAEGIKNFDKYQEVWHRVYHQELERVGIDSEEGLKLQKELGPLLDTPVSEGFLQSTLNKFANAKDVNLKELVGDRVEKGFQTIDGLVKDLVKRSGLEGEDAAKLEKIVRDKYETNFNEARNNYLENQFKEKELNKTVSENQTAKLINHGALDRGNFKAEFEKKFGLNTIPMEDVFELKNLAEKVRDSEGEKRAEYTKQLNDYINELKPDAEKEDKPLWPEYKNEAIDNLKEKGIREFRKAVEGKPALVEFTKRLTKNLEAVMKEKGVIAKGTPLDAMGAIKILTEGIKNFDKYKEVWEGVHDKMVQELQDKMDAENTDQGRNFFQKQINQIDDKFKEIFDNPMAKTVIDRALEGRTKGVRDINYKPKEGEDNRLDLRELVKKTLNQQGDAIENLKAALIKDGGLEGADAEALAKILDKRIKEKLETARKTELYKALNLNPDGTQKGVFKKELRPDKSTVEKIVELIRLGATKDEAFKKAFEDKFELPSLTEKQSSDLFDLGEKAGEAPEGPKRNRALQEIGNYINENVHGSKWSEKLWGLYYANILSSPITHAHNLIGLTTSVVYDTGLALAAHGFKNTRTLKEFIAQNKLFGEAIARGFDKGKTIGESVVHTGDNTEVYGNTDVKAQGTRGIEALKHSKNPVLNAYAKLRYSTRLMAAEDQLFRGVAQEVRASLLAEDMLRKEGKLRTPDGKRMSAEQLKDAVREQLFSGKENLEKAKEQAEKEGYNPNGKGQEGRDFKIRTYQILEKQRNADLMATAEEFAANSTYNGDMHGLLGSMGKAMTQVTNEAEGLKLFVPFVKIGVNAMNAAIDATGIGIASKLLYDHEINTGKKPLGAFLERQTPEAARMAGLRGIGGGLATLALLGYVMNRKKEDLEDFAITGIGTGNIALDQQLYGKGYKAGTIRIGNRDWDYTQSQMLFVFGAAGCISDGKRFGKPHDLTNALGMLTGLGKFVTGQSYLQGINNGLDIVNGGGSRNAGVSFEKFLARGATSFVIPSVAKYLDKAFDPRVMEVNGLEDAFANEIPIARSLYGHQKIDVYGQKVGSDKTITDRVVGSTSVHDNPNSIQLLLAQKGGLSLPKLGTYGDYESVNGGPATRAQFEAYAQGQGDAIRTLLEDHKEELKKDKPETVKKFLTDNVKRVRQMAAAEIGIIKPHGDPAYDPTELEKLYDTMDEEKLRQIILNAAKQNGVTPED